MSNEPNDVLALETVSASLIESPHDHTPTAGRVVVTNPAPNETMGISRRYRARGELGVGGMGIVLEYFDTYMGRAVALKMLRPDRPEDGLSKVLEREARITGRLEHPNIIPVYDAGTDARFGPYYMMRVIKEPTLHQLLARLRKNEAQAVAEYTQGRLLRIFLQVCGALEYAHQHGVVHCDLKPANIMLGKFGEVWVADWGFACEVQRGTRMRGGTPGYMAPEQADSRPDRIDRRSDVFALGAILYELLTFQRAFPGVDVDEMLSCIGRGEPALPSPRPFARVAPTRIIAPELENICRTALQLDPAARYQSAEALASAVEVFLEGTKERELRAARAAAALEQAALLAASYDELVNTNRQRHRELATLRASVPPWADVAEKQVLWDAEEQYAVMDSIRIRTFQSAVAAYEAALDEVPDHPAARVGLAQLYWLALRRAEERRDTFDRIYFESRVNEYDSEGAVHKRSGMLVVDVDAGGQRGDCEIWLERLAEQGRRMVRVEETCFGGTPLVGPKLEAGPYRVRVEEAGVVRAHVPVLIRTGETLHVEVDLQEAKGVHEDEVFVPAGSALLGGHETSALGTELTRLSVPSFYLAKRPVSLADYARFLEDLAVADVERAGRFLPRGDYGRRLAQLEEGRFVFTAAVGTPREHDWGDLPVFGVDVEAAQAYAAWRSRRSGRRYRLPSELEWEKAARGTDGRAYPWGDRFDASFCKMRDSRSVAPHPEAIGSFEVDVSPYGALDMAGGVADWVTTPHEGLVVSRGGAWSDWPSDCHLAARRTYSPQEVASRVGFRLARDVPLHG